MLQDVDSLGIINLRYCGYVAVAKVDNIDKTKVNASIKPMNIADQPEGGAHALNINRLIQEHNNASMLFSRFCLCFILYLSFVDELLICLV